MMFEVRVNTVVLPGGRIEIQVPKLAAGQQATVVITVEEQEQVKQHAQDILANLPGHQLFQNVEEVDAYIREERDAWEIPSNY